MDRLAGSVYTAKRSSTGETYMPRKHKGGWSWSDRAVLILAECIREKQSSAECAQTIQEKERESFPGMEIDKNTILAAMRSKKVPAAIRRLCDDGEELISAFHTKKPGRGMKGKSGGSKPGRKPLRTSAPRPAPAISAPKRIVTAADILAYRQNS